MSVSSLDHFPQDKGAFLFKNIPVGEEKKKFQIKIQVAKAEGFKHHEKKKQ